MRALFYAELKFSLKHLFLLMQINTFVNAHKTTPVKDVKFIRESVQTIYVCEMPQLQFFNVSKCIQVKNVK